MSFIQRFSTSYFYDEHFWCLFSSLTRWYILNILTLVLCFVVLFGLHVPATDDTTIINDVSNTTFAVNSTDSSDIVTSAETEENTDYPVLSGGFLAALVILGSIHLFFAIWMALEYLLGNLRNFVLQGFMYDIIDLLDPCGSIRHKFRHSWLIIWIKRWV